MLSSYNRNGLVFWEEREIEARDAIVNHCKLELQQCLKTLNPAFEFIRIEAPQLTPSELLSSAYSNDDRFMLDDLALRPETTMGSYAAAKDLLNTHNTRKIRMPLIVWQHGKSFRREQDQPTKYMRLKEFYQLEFQIIFSPTTGADYKTPVVNCVQSTLTRFVGPTRTEPSDRLPSYSLSTTDCIAERTRMEVCSISERTDFEGAKVLEVAIGTDRVMAHFLGLI